MASIRLEEDDLERLFRDTDSDCGTDDLDSSQDRSSESEVDKESLLAAGGRDKQILSPGLRQT
jgi:hypothetical protein